VTLATPKQNADVVNEKRREELEKRKRKSGRRRRRKRTGIGVGGVMILKKRRQSEIGEAENGREVGA
jgi:hypothetical protein